MKKILLSFIGSSIIVACLMFINVSAFDYVEEGTGQYIGWYTRYEDTTVRDINNLMYSVVSEGNSYNSWTYSDAARIQNRWMQLQYQPQYLNTITPYRFTPSGVPVLAMEPFNAAGTPQ